MKKTWLCAVAVFVASTKLMATDLMDVYRDALDNDPIFKQAHDSYMASAEAIPQARAALFPQLTVGASAQRASANATVSGFTLANSYYGTVWSLTASQAIFNYQAWAAVRQAKASVKAAQAQFNDAAQNLLLRTSKAYFDVLFAKDTLDFAEAKKRANKKQYDQASQRFEVGLDTITSVYEAKAAYDQSVAQVIAARNNQINQSENLRKLTNRVYDTLSPLRNHTIPLIKPEPQNVNQWIDAGLNKNYNLFVAKYSLESAKENLKSISASSWPVFSIQSNAQQIHNQLEAATVINQAFLVPGQATQANVAIAMNYPIFQGGLVQSQTRQAQFNYKSASEKLEQAQRDVVVNSRIAYNTIIDGISKVKADKQTIISQKNSLDSTAAQFEVGTRTMVDVVNAQQRLFEAQEQLARDQYDLVYSILTLKYLSGSLNVNDLQQVNAWLATTRVKGMAPADASLKH